MTGSRYYREAPPAAAKPEDWRQRALCRDEDPELFFPVGNRGPALVQIEEAKAVCRRCPVVTECLSWALDAGEDSGVWGGMSEDERRKLKRRRNRHPDPATARHFDAIHAHESMTPGLTRVQALAERGYSDTEIAAQVGLSRQRVGEMRKRHQIPPGRAQRGGRARAEALDGAA